MPIIGIRKIYSPKNRRGKHLVSAIFLPANYAETLHVIGVEKVIIALNSFGGIIVPIPKDADASEIADMKSRIIQQLERVGRALQSEPKDEGEASKI